MAGRDPAMKVTGMEFSVDAGPRHRYFPQALKIPSRPTPKVGIDMRNVSGKLKCHEMRGGAASTGPAVWPLLRVRDEMNTLRIELMRGIPSEKKSDTKQCFDTGFPVVRPE